ncbi:MAG: hypothetical protein OHK0053_19460 [Microscillaceae bacterium]
MEKAAFIELMSAHYDSLAELNEKSGESFYDFEKNFDALRTILGRTVLEQQIGSLPQDHRKKTSSETSMEK